MLGSIARPCTSYVHSPVLCLIGIYCMAMHLIHTHTNTHANTHTHTSAMPEGIFYCMAVHCTSVYAQFSTLCLNGIQCVAVPCIIRTSPSAVSHSTALCLNGSKCMVIHCCMHSHTHPSTVLYRIGLYCITVHFMRTPFAGLLFWYAMHGCALKTRTVQRSAIMAFNAWPCTLYALIHPLLQHCAIMAS
jgi:hypothetical protein